MDKTKFITRTFTNTIVEFTRYRLNQDTMEVENLGNDRAVLKGDRNEDYVKPIIQRSHPGEVLKISSISYDRKTYKLATSKFIEIAEEVTVEGEDDTEEVQNGIPEVIKTGKSVKSVKSNS